MNIFILDKNPIKSAKMYCDKHCIKIITECWQMLGSALRRHGVTDNDMPLTKAGTPLKGGYKHHPCTRWCGETKSNFLWAIIHMKALCKEYTYRYNKVHFCENQIPKLLKHINKIPNGELTPFVLAMPDEYKSDDPVESYRKYYRQDKMQNIQCVWTKREQPNWI